MRSFLLVLSACGAIAQSAECQAAEETTLLQGVRMEGGMAVRKQQQMKAKTGSAKDLVKKLKHVAHNLDKMSDDDVDQALQEAADAIDTIPPAINEEVAHLQASVDHAAAAVEACHNEEGVAQREAAWEAAEAQSAVVAGCEAELATLTADEAEICSDAAIAAAQSECACDEARLRRHDKAATCAAHTSAYDFAYCEYSLLCENYHTCHEAEMAVYNDVAADVAAALDPIIQEYIAAEQSACIMAEIQRGMNNPPLNFDTIADCENQDTSHLVIVYPDLPPAPEDCQEPTAGSLDSASCGLPYVEGYERGNQGACRTANMDYGEYARADHVGSLEECAAQCQGSCLAIEFGIRDDGSVNCELHRSFMPESSDHTTTSCYNKSPPHFEGYGFARVGACRTSDMDYGSYSRADHVQNVEECASECDAASDCVAIEYSINTGNGNNGCELHRNPMPLSSDHMNAMCYSKL